MTRIPDEADRDFTAGCLIIDDGKLLLIKHSKLDMWLQPGGHVEERETPDETALRETREETGFVVEILEQFRPEKEEIGGSYNLPTPFCMNAHQIRDGHWHCSMLYIAKVIDKREATHIHEKKDMRWFSKEDLEDSRYDIPENIRDAGRNALDIKNG